MKVLITGGAGFIGSHIADLLIQNNHKIIIVDNLSTGKKENINPKSTFYLQDISDKEALKQIFEKEKPEIVYHLAAEINLRKSINFPVENAYANIINTLHLLDLCVKNKVQHFIFSSTGGAIYGDTETIPTKENEKENPLSPYGCSKLAIEKYLNFYNKVHGLKYTALRYSNVYGPRQDAKGEAGVIAIFFNNLFSKKNVEIFGGIQTRDFVYVKDVARANLLALQDKKSSIYNVGTGKEMDMIEIFNHVNKYFGNKIKPEYKKMCEGEQKKSCLSHEKIKEALGWQPTVSFEEGLNQTYCWHMKKFQQEKNSELKL